VAEGGGRCGGRSGVGGDLAIALKGLTDGDPVGKGGGGLELVAGSIDSEEFDLGGRERR